MRGREHNPLLAVAREKREKRIVELWNEGDFNLGDIAHALHLGQTVVRDVIAAAFITGQTKRPLKRPRVRVRLQERIAAIRRAAAVDAGASEAMSEGASKVAGVALKEKKKNS